MEQQPVKAELTGRQRARMADLSLLLDVILKTQASSAKQAICKNGILHQLQVYSSSRTASSLPANLKLTRYPLEVEWSYEIRQGILGNLACSTHLRAVFLLFGRIAVVDGFEW